MRAPGKPSGPGTFPLAVGAAMSLLSCALLAIALHALMDEGTCSSTGYTKYGPAPHCHTGWYVAALIAGLALTFFAMASAVPAWLLFLAPFASAGVGSLVAAVGSPPPGAGRGFAIGFGVVSIALGITAAHRLGGGRRERPP